jgi:glycosyltransferase involved in cell wall biosynthesis
MDTRDVNMLAGDWRNRLRVLFYRVAHALANRWADGQTAITERMADWVGVPPQQLWGIWPSGANLDRFAKAQRDRLWPANGEPIHLVYVGALLAERNLLPLCHAIQAASGAGMELILTVVGDGPARGELEEFAQGGQAKIRVLPVVPHEQIPEVLAQAHVGVASLASPDEQKYQASSPIKLFEYMASGLPILATRNPCYVDVLGKGKIAFWTDDASVEGLMAALGTIWGARSSLRRMGLESAFLAREWSWRASARKLSRGLKKGLHRDAGDLSPASQWQ